MPIHALRSNRICTTIMLLAVVSAAALAAGVPAIRGPVRGPIGQVPPKTEAEQFAQYNRAGTILAATVTSLGQIAQTRSIPPSYFFRFEIGDIEAIRGEAPEETTLRYSTRRAGEIPNVGQKVFLIVSQMSDGKGGTKWVVSALDKQSKDLRQRIEKAISVPVGWAYNEDKPVSPWAGQGDIAAWPAKAELGTDAKVRCSVTGRPALMCGEGITLTVEQIEPEKKIKWQNPYGDGRFRVTLTNANKEAEQLPALLADAEGNILWRHSLVIISDGNMYAPHRDMPIPADVRSAQIDGGKSVTYEVNTLALQGIAWPRGGRRVQFTFAVGEKSATNFFYYYSKLHDPMVDEAVKENVGKEDEKTAP